LRGRGRIVIVIAVVGLAGAVSFGVVQPITEAPESSSAQASTVLLVGDSLIHQAADGIRAALPGMSVVDGSVPGSGLLNGPVDWSARAAALVARHHPGTVVVSFIGNYDQYAGHLVPGTPAFYGAWADAAQRLTDQLRQSGAHVDWVEQPPLRTPNFYGIEADRTAVLLELSRHLAAEPGVELVRAVHAVAAPDGSFAATHDVCGSTVALRIADGVHFTAIGGNWWGAHVGRAVAQLAGHPTRDPCTVMAGLHPRQP
jgi:hypothetical protein